MISQGDNLGRYRSPNQCGWCGSIEHSDGGCPTRDANLRDQLKADEAAAVDEIAKTLTTKAVRVAWVRVVLAGFRKAQRIEDQADARELTDFLKSEVRL